MIQTTINIELAPPPSMHCVAALANVIRHLAWFMDQPESRNSSAQELLYMVAKALGSDSEMHADAVKLTEFLMRPVDGAPKRRRKGKLRVVPEIVPKDDGADPANPLLDPQR